MYGRYGPIRHSGQLYGTERCGRSQGCMTRNPTVVYSTGCTVQFMWTVSYNKSRGENHREIIYTVPTLFRNIRTVWIFRNTKGPFTRTCLALCVDGRHQEVVLYVGAIPREQGKKTRGKNRGWSGKIPGFPTQNEFFYGLTLIFSFWPASAVDTLETKAPPSLHIA